MKLRIERFALRRRWLLAGAILALILGVSAVAILRPYWRVVGQFADNPQRQPSRLYARSLDLAVGEPLAAQRLEAELETLRYRAVEGDGDLLPGTYRKEGGRFEIAQRAFAAPGGWVPEVRLEVRIRGSRIRELAVDGREMDRALLEPPLLASFYGEDFKERRPVRYEDVPEHLVQAVLAAEDERFFKHSGVSIKGIVRAVWANLSSDGPLQGGSTLTQQLVKNLYLTHDRTVARKTREGILALFLDLRYTKEEILQAYLNEIYLGASGRVNLIGMGAAARAYFGKEVRDLDLGEAAMLAGMIPAPAHYSPLTHPEQAKVRRNLILDRLAELEWAPAAEIESARARPLPVYSDPPVRRRAGHFVERAVAEAEARFGVAELADAGYVLLSTLSWHEQQKAEEAVRWGLKALEDGWEKSSKAATPLQCALVSVDPRDGSIVAYVGGRDYQQSQFDRAGQARRQAGSAFKPVVFAAAIERGVAMPSSLVQDEPLTVRLASQRWAPQNDDGEFRGWVSAREALERSLNVPTARLALSSGLKEVVSAARDLGVTAPLEPYPSLALGAFELTPVELATVYSAFAAQGVRPPVHALVAAFDRQRTRLEGSRLPSPERALTPQTAYLLTSMLQGVLDRGTARSVRQAGLHDALAGKTGTSNDRRDSWFAGYAPSRATVVWVGYDDNAETRLSGTRAALPIWTRFAHGVRPAGGYGEFQRPRGVVSALIDPESGALATESCPEVTTEVFLQTQVPDLVCPLHRGWGRFRAEARYEDPEDRTERRGGFRRWLNRVFGGDHDRQREAERRQREAEERRDGERPPA